MTGVFQKETLLGRPAPWLIALSGTVRTCRSPNPAGATAQSTVHLVEFGEKMRYSCGMERKSLAADDCPIARVVDLIGEWGSLLILREVFRGATRFDELQRSLDISRNLLTSRLKKLVDGGVLDRKPISSDAKRMGYFLTPMGADLFATLVAIRQWGDRWLFEPGCTPADLIDSKKKKVLPRMRSSRRTASSSR
jgi:DNA-binding HxlR family transcriptional regulator